MVSGDFAIGMVGLSIYVMFTSFTVVRMPAGVHKLTQTPFVLPLAAIVAHKEVLCNIWLSTQGAYYTFRYIGLMDRKSCKAEGF